MRLVAMAALLAVGAAAACSSSSTIGGGAPSDPSASPTDPTTGPGSATDGGANDGATPGETRDAAPPVTYARKVLDFDDVEGGTTITSQYATWATFSSDPGCSCQTSGSAGLAASKPLYLWTYATCATGASASFFVAFAKPVRAIRFKLIGVNGSGKVATARVVHRDGTKTSKDVIGKGNYADPVVVDLPDTDVTNLEIVDVNDAYGLGLDDLELDAPQ